MRNRRTHNYRTYRITVRDRKFAYVLFMLHTVGAAFCFLATRHFFDVDHLGETVGFLLGFIFLVFTSISLAEDIFKS